MASVYLDEAFYKGLVVSYAEAVKDGVENFRCTSGIEGFYHGVGQYFFVEFSVFLQEIGDSAETALAIVFFIVKSIVHVEDDTIEHNYSRIEVLIMVLNQLYIIIRQIKAVYCTLLWTFLKLSVMFSE